MATATKARSASFASRTARAPKLVGREAPRVYTPSLRKLEPRSAATEKRTLGYAVIDFAEHVLAIDLYPWQKWLLIHALELLPDGSFRFRNVVVLVARQSGKSTLSQVLALFYLYVLGTSLVIGTAQDLDVAEEIWQGAVDLVEETPDLDALKERVVKVNGKKSLELKTGERYKVKAANRRAGRGLSGDLILLDELREHQTWDAWGAVTKTTMARPNAQVWALSNAGDATSIVLRYLRKMAHRALGDPDGIVAADDPAVLLPDDDEAEAAETDFEVDDTSLGLFEWSAAPGRAVMDRDGWAEANPSLGFSIAERTILSAARTDPEWVFRTEVLCQWSDGTLAGMYPAGTWEASRSEHGARTVDGRRVLAVDVSHDRSRTHIAIAGHMDDGRILTGLVQSRAGTDWVTPYLSGRTEDELPPFDAVAVQGRGAPASSLIEDLRDAGVPVVEVAGPDLTGAFAQLYDAVAKGEESPVLHRPQPALEVAAATAVPKLTEGGAVLIDRVKSKGDVAPLIACALAVWALLNAAPAVSAYAEYDFAVI